MANLSVINWRRAFGLVMLAIGALILVRVYVMHRPSQLGQTMDTVFGIFFIVRGALYRRMARKRTIADSTTISGKTTESPPPQ